MIKGLHLNTSSSTIFCVLLMVLSSFVFFLPDSPFCPSILVGLMPVIMLIVAVLLFMTSSKKDNRLTSFLYIFSALTYWCLEFIHSYHHLSISSILVVFVLSCICMSSSFTKREAFRWYYYIVSATAFLGIVSYVLYKLRIGPFLVVDYYTDESFASYASYYVSNILALSFNEYDLSRLCGLYNEPGLLGTICALLLAADNFKHKGTSFVLLFAGILTFSAAFWLLLVLFFALRAFINGSTRTKIVSACIILVFFYLVNQSYDNIILENFFNRFRFEDGQLNGDDRIDSSLQMYWNATLKDTHKLLWGYGSYIKIESSSSIILWIVKHGIIGTLAFMLPLLIASFKEINKNKVALVFVLMFIISIYQRPQVFNAMFFVMLIGGIEYIKKQSRNDTIKV